MSISGTFEDIQATLIRDETPDETAFNVLKTVQQRLAQSEDNSSKLLIIVQQISLMFSILQQFNTLKQTLSAEQNQTA